MPYTNIDRCYHISRYASYKYGQKVTSDQLREAIVMIVRSKSEDVINRFVEMVQEDNGDLAEPQFEKKDGFYKPTPNRPKSPNELIAEAFNEREKKQAEERKRHGEEIDRHLNEDVNSEFWKKERNEKTGQEVPLNKSD